MRRKANKNRDDVVYARCFKDQFAGHAVYQALSILDLKPGTCGYFLNGRWKEVADLTRDEKKGYTFVPGIAASEGTVKVQWPLRKSTNMQLCGAGASGGGGVPGVASGKATIAFQSTSGEGALLLTNGNVTCTEAEPISQMCEWMVQNAKTVYALDSAAKGEELWVVTTTYSVPERQLAVVKDKQTKVTMEVAAHVQDAADIRLHADFWKQSAGQLWERHQDDIGVVLAFDGISWRDSWYKREVKPVKYRTESHLGGDGSNDYVLSAFTVDAEDLDPENPTLEIEPEIHGNIRGVRYARSDEEQE